MTTPEDGERGAEPPDFYANHTLLELIALRDGSLERIGTTPEQASTRLRLLGYRSEDLEEDFSGRGSHNTRTLIIISKGNLARHEDTIFCRLRYEDGYRDIDYEDPMSLTPTELGARGIDYSWAKEFI